MQIYYSLGLNVLLVGHTQLSSKQRNLSAPHQTKIVDWLGPPYSFTVWHGPRFEWCWWCCVVGRVGGSHWELAPDGERGDSKTLRHCVPLL